VARQKKFGAFAGVFTPSVLTILGVIMYMRMGWVVGNAGLIGTMLIVLLAHIISISTGLSVSSIATDKKVGAGGIYYILSRSMGIPIGGAIGIALYVGTALSIALYLIGFAESFNSYLGFSTDINGLRISGSVALFALTAIALISTSVALKTQFFILAAIILSLVSIFWGSNEFAPTAAPELLSSEGSVDMATVFAVFFPAVTGFTAGIAMSGDLQDPKKDIPVGTIAAIAVGFIVYMALAAFISYNVNTDLLRSDNNILMTISYYAPAVVAGVWGATLSSALGGILGGPRILQAMSIDKVTPKIFGKGKGKNNEPVNALFLVFIIAQMGILIGELDVIAGVVSMFYLAAYGFINLSFFLESWANPDFQPTFKVNRWFGLVGFVACFGIMFKLDMVAMFGSIFIIMGIYFWLQRKQIMLDSGDVWRSVWENIVAKGLKRLEQTETTNNNWNPNIILFSGEQEEERPQLLTFSKIVSGRTGMVTNFNLIINADGSTPLTKNKQNVKDETLENLGIFGRKIEVDNIYKGIENIAATFGFSGIEPNTIMMTWPKNIQDQVNYAQMTEKLIHLDYNLLYLDYDKRYEFGQYKTIDLWWRGTDNNNAEMMLNIARFIVQASKWSSATIRVLFVNYNNVDNAIIKSKIAKLISKLRIDAEIKIINNGVEQKPFYDIIELQSANTDLIVLGIPNIPADKQAAFVLKTNELFETIGTTLLVKASDDFNELDLDFSQEKRVAAKQSTALNPLPVSADSTINDLVSDLDKYWDSTANELTEPSLSTIASFYYQYIDSVDKVFDKTLLELRKQQSAPNFIAELQNFLSELTALSENFRNDKLHSLEEILEKGLHQFINERKVFVAKASKKVKSAQNGGRWIYWKEALEHYFDTKILAHTQHTLYELGVQNFISINQLAENIANQSQLVIENIVATPQSKESALEEFKNNITQFIVHAKEIYSGLEHQIIHELKAYERDACIALIKDLENPDLLKNIKKAKKKELLLIESNLYGFASDWKRNQALAHKQVESELNLSIAGLSVFNINEKIKVYVQEQVITPQEDRIASLLEIINHATEHLSTKNKVPFNDKELDLLAESIAHVNFTSILENDENNILSISRSVSKVTDLMSAESFNVLFKSQAEDVESLSINLANIEDYIIQSSYLSPLHKSMHDLAVVYNNNSEEVYNLANLIKHVIDESIHNEDNSYYETVVQEVQQRIEQTNNKLESSVATFNHAVNTNLHNTSVDLNIRTIIESIDSYSGASQKPIITNRFQDWFNLKQKSTAKAYHNALGLVAQRKRDINTLKFDSKHYQYLNNIEQTSNFMAALSIQASAEQALPFYYKKLFTGSHLNNVNSISRIKELSLAQNAIHRVDQGTSGAIIIIGTSLSGKTFFTETVAKTLVKTEKYYINPPSKQKFDATDLHKAFQKTFSKAGTTESILNQLDQKSVLIFNDIEEWWVKSPDGNQAINYLSKIIENFGNRHYFLLNCNLQSFHIIRKTSNLEKNLLSTIIMSPASKSELKDIILSRHKTAGAELWFKDNLVDVNKKIDVLLNDIHLKTKGTIGVALNSWVYNIQKTEEDKLIIEKPSSLTFPNIKDPNWKILLYHILIHNRLKEGDLHRIFGSKTPTKMFDSLKEMKKAGLIYKQSQGTYVLNHHAKYYVENWLTELKILN
jgi:solute carrier family 12 sodium/potassium/chloride transporter 2